MPISKTVAVGQKPPQSWPWKLWSALIAVFALCIAAYWFLKPALEFSRPELNYHDRTCTAQFDATNHTDSRVGAVLRVVLGSSRPGDGDYPPSYTEYARKTFSVSFMPREKKTLTCDIIMPSPTLRANDTRIEVESFSESSR